MIKPYFIPLLSLCSGMSTQTVTLSNFEKPKVCLVDILRGDGFLKLELCYLNCDVSLVMYTE